MSVLDQRIFRKDVYFERTEYDPFEGQREVHYCPTRNRALTNGRRWGKTLVGGKEVETTCWVKNKLSEPQRWWIVGPQYPDCEKEFRIVYDSLKKLDVDLVSSKFLRNTENGNMHIKTNWGWDLQCRSAQHPETLVGEGLDGVLLVEAGRLRRKTFTEYIRPALSDKRGRAFMSGVPEIATDESLLYWSFQRGRDSSRATWASWQMPSWTNPIVFPGGRQDPEILEAEEDLTEDEFRRQYGGEFVERIGRVMQEYDQDIHFRKLRYNPDWPLYAAIDFGWSNLYVWLWIQVDPFGKVYVIGEICKRMIDSEDMAELYIKPHPLFSKLQAIYPDPASPDDVNILTKHLGVEARTNTGGPIMTRVNLIRSALKLKPQGAPRRNQEPGLVIDTDCTMLDWEMSTGYRWPEHRSETRGPDELPMDKDNHCCEALGRFYKGYFSVQDDSHRRTVQRQARFRR